MPHNVETSTPTLSTPTSNADNGKYKHIKIITHQSTCNKNNTCQSCVTCVNNSDVMQSKAELYLMAVKGLLNKVSQIESSLSLVNLK